MKLRRTHFLWLVRCVAVFTVAAHGALPLDDDFETVSSVISNGYKRVLRPDGSPEPETYTFLRGGERDGAIADPTLDRMRFEDIAATLARSLAARGYVPSNDRAKLKLLVVVYWGATMAPIRTTASMGVATAPPSDARPNFQESLQEFMPSTEFAGGAPGGVSLARTPPSFAPGIAAIDSAGIRAEAARLLGYASSEDPDLLGGRYFVVLLAYDFQEKLRIGTNRLLWQTRFSIATRHHDFSQQLRAMAVAASGYFGRDSGGLGREAVPEGRVEIGETRVIDAGAPETESQAGGAALAPDGAHVAWWRRHRGASELVITALDGTHAPIVAEIPQRRSPARLAWEDAQRVVVAATDGAAPLTVAVSGRWLNSDGPARALLATAASLVSEDPALKALRHRIAVKLPERTVTLLGVDARKRRVLLLATDAARAGRYFVFDTVDDLLIEVGSRQP